MTDILFKNFKARSIGPAAMGGRVSDIAIDPRNPAIFFVGLSTGGLFKTGDNCVTFDSTFDKQPVQSIGAVAIAPSDTDIVWVGTGENAAEGDDGLVVGVPGKFGVSGAGEVEGRVPASVADGAWARALP